MSAAPAAAPAIRPEDHLGLLNTIARRYQGLGKQHGMEPEDLFQEGYLGLHRAAQNYDPARGEWPAFAATWIIGSIRRAIERRANRPMRPLPVTEEGRDVEPPARDEGDPLEAGEERERLAALLGQLPEEERNLLVRRYGLDGRKRLSLAALAREVGSSKEGVRLRIKHILAGMRKRLEAPA